MFFGDDSESDQSGSVSDWTMLSLVAFTSLTSHLLGAHVRITVPSID